MEKELKPHWRRLIREVEQMQNGSCTLDFQNGLPVGIREIEGKKRDVDLTKEG